MCGIAGAIEFKSSKKVDFSHGSIMHRYIGNRGPNFYANTLIENDNWDITMAHSRLAIIDLTAASNQPMHSENKQFTIVFNGEIYNYKEIREDLKKEGVLFNTDGDTEVLLKSWQRWGKECLQKFNGMFAFGIYDKERQEFSLVRDRFGVKPLAFHFNSLNRLVFSSSSAAVAQAIQTETNLGYCFNGLRFGFYEGYENHTPFSNVSSVNPGTIIKFKLVGDRILVEEEIWYSLIDAVNKKTTQLTNLSEEQLIEMGKDLIESSVKLRLRSDVPLAVSLSGGVDSSAIAAISKTYVEGLTAFSYGSPNSSKSEGPVIEKFVKEQNIKVNYIYPNYTKQELGDVYDDTLSAQEAPFLGLSIMAQHEVYKEVKKNNFKVLLGGQGGDEIFAGYRKFFLVAMRDSFKNGEYADALSYFFSLGLMLINEVQQVGIYWNERKRYLTNSGKDLFFLHQDMEISHNILGEENLRDRQILDIQRYSIPTLLRYEDKNSMFHSIESRLPFMDYRMVEFALALPDGLKIKNGFGKWGLRCMLKDKVPQYILHNRQKRGFDVTQSWVEEGVGVRIISNLLGNKSKIFDYVTDYGRFEKQLTLENLKNDNFLNEAITLNFLINPYRFK